MYSLSADILKSVSIIISLIKYVRLLRAVLSLRAGRAKGQPVWWTEKLTVFRKEARKEFKSTGKWNKKAQESLLFTVHLLGRRKENHRGSTERVS